MSSRPQSTLQRLAGGPARAVLIVVAARSEASHVLRAFGLAIDRVLGEWERIPVGEAADLVISGVGKANAAGAAARVLDPTRHAGVISAGLCGALPGSDLQIGDVVLAQQSVCSDEGIETPDGFMDSAAMGFPLGPFEGPGVVHDTAWIEPLAPFADRRGVIATVSTCSGTDNAALRVVARTDGIAEAMEGAAVAQVGVRLGVKTAELRVVSNTTGDRSAQRWELARALERLGEVIGALVAPR